MPKTYKNGVDEHANFDKERFNKYDERGRQYAKIYLEQKGLTVVDNDKKEDGTVDYTKPDLKAYNKDVEMYFEVAIKEDSIFRYITEGVDIETRKTKYFQFDQKSALLMFNASGNEMVSIPLKALKLAKEDCGDEYLGHKIESSENFNMPSHGCHRVKKVCKGKTTETFFRIPYQYASYWVNIDGKWIGKKRGVNIVR